MMKIMSPEHEKWEEFLNCLEGSEGCNFHKREEDGETVWNCEAGHNKNYAAKIMLEMGEIDIAGSFKYFEENGGHCDCEILFNVASS